MTRCSADVMGSFDFFEETKPRQTAENTAMAVLVRWQPSTAVAVKVHYTITSNIMLFLFYTLFHLNLFLIDIV